MHVTLLLSAIVIPATIIDFNDLMHARAIVGRSNKLQRTIRGDGIVKKCPWLGDYCVSWITLLQKIPQGRSGGPFFVAVNALPACCQVQLLLA
jgi:hypothetical protein